MAWAETYVWIAVVGVGVTACLLIILDHPRLGLAALAAQYGWIAWISAVALSPIAGAVKLTTGLLAAAILALTLARLGWSTVKVESRSLPSSGPFRIVAALLVLISAWGLSRSGWDAFLGVSDSLNLAAHFLVLLGMLHVGLSEAPFRVGMGLLTALGGFELIYTTIEPSLAILALLAAVNLGIALVMSYLLAPDVQPREGEQTVG